jgi:hypothetical protein
MISTPAAQNTDSMAPWIVGAIVVGVVTTFAVVGVAVFVILKRRAAPKVPGQTSSEARPQAPAAPAQSQYGLLPVAIKPHVYNDGRIDLPLCCQMRVNFTVFE